MLIWGSECFGSMKCWGILVEHVLNRKFQWPRDTFQHVSQTQGNSFRCQPKARDDPAFVVVQTPGPYGASGAISVRFLCASDGESRSWFFSSRSLPLRMVLPLKQEAGAAYLCFSVNRLHLHRLAPSRHQLHSHSGALRFYSLPSLRRGGFQCVYLNGPGFWTGSESLQRTALHCTACVPRCRGLWPTTTCGRNPSTEWNKKWLGNPMIW